MITATADADTRAEIRRTAQQINDQIQSDGRADPTTIGDLLFLILGPETNRRVVADRGPH